MFSCNNAAEAIDKLMFVDGEELGLLLAFGLASECGDGGSAVNKPFMSVVLVSCICKLFFNLMIALSSEFNVDLLDLDELCSCIVKLCSMGV